MFRIDRDQLRYGRLLSVLKVVIPIQKTTDLEKPIQGRRPASGKTTRCTGAFIYKTILYMNAFIENINNI